MWETAVRNVPIKGQTVYVLFHLKIVAQEPPFNRVHEGIFSFSFFNAFLSFSQLSPKRTALSLPEADFTSERERRRDDRRSDNRQYSIFNAVFF